MDSLVLKGLIVYTCMLFNVYGAQNAAIRHLNMKVNRLNRIISVLQSDVGEIKYVLSSTLIDGHENGTDTDCDGITTTDSVMQRVNDTVSEVQDLKSEVENLVLIVKLGMKAEKMFQRELMKNLSHSYQESVNDLTKDHLEFQNHIRAETIQMKEKINQLELMKEKINQLEQMKEKVDQLGPMKEKIDQLESMKEKITQLEPIKEKFNQLEPIKEKFDQLKSGQFRLKEENQECQNNLENITQVLGESITENQAGIRYNLAMLHDLAIIDKTLESNINQISEGTNENFNKLFACEEVEGWERFDSHCYFFSSNARTWYEALEACKSENSYMVELDYASEVQYVVGHGASFWVGANDKETEGIFIWQHSSKKVDAGFWKPGEPNNHVGNEDCVRIYSGGKTNDVPCMFKTKFVCERPFLA